MHLERHVIFLDLFFGIGMFLCLLLFHAATRGLFISIWNFDSFSFLVKSNGVGLPIIAVSSYGTIAGLAANTRTLMGDVSLFDISQICLIPCFILFLIATPSLLLELREDKQQSFKVIARYSFFYGSQFTSLMLGSYLGLYLDSVFYTKSL